MFYIVATASLFIALGIGLYATLRVDKKIEKEKS